MPERSRAEKGAAENPAKVICLPFFLAPFPTYLMLLRNPCLSPFWGRGHIARGHGRRSQRPAMDMAV